ncbi:uncharacterized protein LOC108913467 [Anoplophora glabripennis]|nr:uncharacterized protein LOC108913467 [Anoplophora glabripennis]
MFKSNITRMLSLTPKLRARLIKFRYGPARDQQTSSAATPASAGSIQHHQNQQPGEALWDFQIPSRWKRRPLTEEEIAVINNGGPL